MADKTPTLQTWRKLYDAACRLKEIAPWQWMTETDIFGVQSPGTGELGFVSIMGQLGEHYAIAVYAGPEALYKFWALQHAGPDIAPEFFLEIPQFQASFENRNALQKQDHTIIKKLGLKFRGAQAWPLFRSFRPGFVPWFLEADEAAFLLQVLEQAQDVVRRYNNDAVLFPSPRDGHYLVRVPSQEQGHVVWEDRILQVPPPEPRALQFVLDTELLDALKSLPRQRLSFEVDVFMSLNGVQEKPARPYYPFVFMLVDADSGMVLAADLLPPTPSLEAMWSEVPQRLLSHLAQVKRVPSTVRVRSPLLLQLLQPVAEELGIQLKQSRHLRSLDAAKKFLLERFI
jgi:hypothetical protein